MQGGYRKGLMPLLAMAAVLAALIVGPGTSFASTETHARPMSGSSCDGNAPWDYLALCIEVNGTGLHIDTAVSGACTQSQPVGNPQLYGHVAMYAETSTDVGINGWIGNGPDGWASDGSCFPSFTWQPYHNEPAGYYCTVLWIKTGAHSWKSEGGEPCLYVHK
jgi:hypothetical protein